MKLKLGILLFIISIRMNAQNALHFDGVNDYAQSTMSGPLGNSPRTVEAWINWSGAFTSQGTIVDWGAATNGNRFTLNIINGVPRIEAQGNGINATVTLQPNTWHHLAASYNDVDDTVKLYVDGNLSAKGILTVTINTNNSYPITIGRRADTVSPLSLFSYFGGAIDEVRIWNSVLTKTEINSIKNKEFCTAPNNLVAYYNFNEGMAGGNNSAIDSVSEHANNNSAMLYNLALTGSASNFIQGASLSNITANVTQNQNTLTANTGFNYQWLDCNIGNTAIAGATNQVYQATTTGNYSVVISQNWCIDTSSCFSVSSITNLSNREDELTQYFAVYPNPVSKNSLLTITGFENNAIRYSLLDAQGKMVVNNNSKSNTISLPNELENGFYILVVEGNNKKMRRKILVKE